MKPIYLATVYAGARHARYPLACATNKRDAISRGVKAFNATGWDAGVKATSRDVNLWKLDPETGIVEPA